MSEDAPFSDLSQIPWGVVRFKHNGRRTRKPWISLVVDDKSDRVIKIWRQAQATKSVYTQEEILALLSKGLQDPSIKHS